MKTGDDGSSILDHKDRMILSLLQKSAEISLSDMGKKVDLTKMAVSNRIRNLKKSGVIEGSFYKVSGQKVGQDYVLITRITCQSKGQEQDRIAETLSQITGIQSVYQVFGSFDLMVIARRKDKTSAKLLVREIAKIPGIRNTVTIVPHTVVKESLYVDTLSEV
jgi:Lrp/AsnC family transcriptional regulator, leucine-responsive regulatory protein